jgi:hypothetical protein
MKIKANGIEIDNVTVHEERQLVVQETSPTLAMDDRPIRRINLPTGISDAMVTALKAGPWTVTDNAKKETVHTGFNQLLRHEIVFAGWDDAPILQTVKALQTENANLKVLLAAAEAKIPK